MKLCLNIGCGDRTYDFYPTNEYKCVNFDGRDSLKKVDEVGDVKDLSRFGNETFDFILASDIIEHFPVSDTDIILQEWKRVLKIGGTIEFRLPDLRAICNAYINGINDARLTSWLIMGGQDYPGNFHYVIFDRNWLSSVLTNLGFMVTEISDSGHNFELKAVRMG